MAHEAPGHTLQPTALVHEAWLRLVGNGNQQWNGRAHFFGAAAEAMRRILIEKARLPHRPSSWWRPRARGPEMLDIATAMATRVVRRQ